MIPPKIKNKRSQYKGFAPQLPPANAGGNGQKLFPADK
jgi:hypothetical protein